MPEPRPLNIELAQEMRSYISVDVETAGPFPGEYSLLSIGACTLTEPQRTFYIELQPVQARFSAEALQVSGLEMEQLAKTGHPPIEAMREFVDWLEQVVPQGQRPIFVAFNAPFDWMFVNEYFQRYLGRNPFGHAALDIKAFAMGRLGCTWQDTSMRKIGPRYNDWQPLTHNALQDAKEQAELFLKLLAE